MTSVYCDCGQALYLVCVCVFVFFLALFLLSLLLDHCSVALEVNFKVYNDVKDIKKTNQTNVEDVKSLSRSPTHLSFYLENKIKTKKQEIRAMCSPSSLSRPI